MPIVQKDHPVLRTIAQEVPLSDISSTRIRTVIQEMKKALIKEDDGVAIAAPQIGEPLRMFVVSHKVFQKYDEDDKPIPPVLTIKNDKVFINPKVIKISKKKEPMEEGCLSVRWWYGYVERATQATIEAYDEHGKRITVGAGGLLAQIFQHEIDHLNGTLFIDKATGLKEIDPEELRHASH